MRKDLQGLADFTSRPMINEGSRREYKHRTSPGSAVQYTSIRDDRYGRIER